MNKRKIGALSLAVVMGLSVFATACGSKSSEAKKKQITVAMTSTFAGTFNPVLYEDQYDAYVLNFTFDSLWAQDEKVETTIPVLAESWKETPNKDGATIKLKKDLKWHDGKPLTIDDVIFTWEFIANKDYQGPRFDYVESIKGARAMKDGKATKLEGVKKVDDQTVEVTFEKPDARDISTKLWSIPIPKHIWESKLGSIKNAVNDPATTKKVVGSGPFKVKDFKAGQYVLVEKFKEHHKQAKLDNIVLKVVQPDVAIAALQKGEIDMLASVPMAEVDKVKTFSNVEIKETPDFGYQYLGFKTKNPVVSDKNLRRAIAYAINRQALVDGLMGGRATLLSQAIAPVSYYYDQKLDASYIYSADKAKETLAAAGYKDVNGDGFVEDKAGKPLVVNLDYPVGNPVREKSAPLIKADIEKAGIKVNLRKPRDFKSHSEFVERDDTDVHMWLMGWGTDTDPDQSGAYKSDAPFNYSRWGAGTDSDKLIDAQKFDPKALASKEGRKELLSQWSKLFQDESPVVFLYSMNQIDAKSKRVLNAQFDWHGYVEHPAFTEWDVKE